jgi:hypothetical protein
MFDSAYCASQGLHPRSALALAPCHFVAFLIAVLIMTYCFCQGDSFPLSLMSVLGLWSIRQSVELDAVSAVKPSQSLAVQLATKKR